MSGKIAFEGIGEVRTTFYAADGVAEGQVVKVTEDGTVGPCAAGESFCGVARSVWDGCAGVQVGGFAEVSTRDANVTAGYVSLAADGQGGVKKAGDGENGRELLVVLVDAGVATVKL